MAPSHRRFECLFDFKKSPDNVAASYISSVLIAVTTTLTMSTFHEFHEIHHSVSSYFKNKDSKRCCDTSTPESIHTKDESKRETAFAFIFGVN